MDDKQDDEVTKNVALDDNSPLMNVQASQLNVQDSFNEIGFSKGTKPGLNDEGIDVTDGELHYRGAGSQGDGTQEKMQSISGFLIRQRRGKKSAITTETDEDSMQEFDSSSGEEQTDENQDLLRELSVSLSDTDRRYASLKKKFRAIERRRQQFWYLIWRLCLSLFGHGILLGLSFKFGFGEETSGHHEEGNSRKWLKWGVMNLIFPSVVFPAMVIVQKFLIDRDDIPEDRVKWCKIVNLAAITWSKVVYFAIRELPGVNVKVRFITAHAVAVVIDMASAVYLYRNHGCLDQDIGG